MRDSLEEYVQPYKRCKECDEIMYGVRDYKIRDKHTVCGGVTKFIYNRNKE